MPSTHLSLREDDVIRLALEFLHNRDLHIAQLSLERETGVINGNFADDVLFLRQLILDGQWDDVIEFIQPLSTLEAFDAKKFNYAILRHKYMELLCIKSEIKVHMDVEDVLEEVVKVLKDLEKLAPSKQEYANLCLLLTLPSITEHAQYKNWNPSNARVQCFIEIYPLVEPFLPSDKKSAVSAHKCAKNDRLMQLLIKGILYESCVKYCQIKATGSDETQSSEVNFSRLLEGSGFDNSNLSLLSWLQSIPAETFNVPFEQRILNVAVEKLDRPSLHTSWTEHMLVTPIKPRTFPHLSMPFKRPRSAADAMTRSLRPLPDGAPRFPAVMAFSAIDCSPSTSSSNGFHLTYIKTDNRHMNTSVDRLFDSKKGDSIFNGVPESLEPIEEVIKPVCSSTAVKGIRNKRETSTATTPEHRVPDPSIFSPTFTAASLLAGDVNYTRDLLKKYQMQKQRECEDYLRTLTTSEIQLQDENLWNRSDEASSHPEGNKDSSKSGTAEQLPGFIASDVSNTIGPEVGDDSIYCRKAKRAIASLDEKQSTPPIDICNPGSITETSLVFERRDSLGVPRSPARDLEHPSTFPSTLRRDRYSPSHTPPRRDTPSPTQRFATKRHSMGSFPNLSRSNIVNYNRRESVTSSNIRDMKRDYVGSMSSLSRKSSIDTKKSSSDSLDTWHISWDSDRLNSVSSMTHDDRHSCDHTKSQNRSGGGQSASATNTAASGAGAGAAGVASAASSSRPPFKPITVLEDLQAVRCAEFHPSGMVYAVGSNTKTLRICTYPKAEEINVLSKNDAAPTAPTVLMKRTKHHKGSIYCLAWSPAGDLLATGSNDKTVKLMRYNNQLSNLEGQEMELTMHDGTVRDLLFIEDTTNKTSLLVSGGAGDCKIYVTDCATAKPFQALSGHSGHVLSLYNWGGAMFVSGSQDKTVRFWDLRTGGCINIITPPSGIPNKGLAVASLAVDPTGRLLVSGHDDGTCALYDVRGSRVLKSFTPHASDLRSVRFSPGAYYLLTAGYDGRVVLTDLQGDLTCTLPSLTAAFHPDKVISARWHPEEFLFLSTSADKTAVLWTIPAV